MRGSTWSGEQVRRWLIRAGTAAWVAAGIVLLLLALRTAGAAAAPASAPPGTADDAAFASKYRPDYEFATGPELVLVFVGASFCGADRQPGFRQALEDAKVLVERQAKARGIQFRTHGISLDWQPRQAMAALARFGAFDEVSLGSNWLNDGALRYIWRDYPSVPQVPQVLLVQRRIETQPQVRVTEERVVRRFIGTDQVMKWVAEGATL
jgi:hypothetical protein